MSGLRKRIALNPKPKRGPLAMMGGPLAMKAKEIPSLYMPIQEIERGTYILKVEALFG